METRNTQPAESTKEWEKILGALNCKELDGQNLTWRTIKGISNQTGIDPRIIHYELYAHPKIVVEASRKAHDGREAYSTRKRHREFRTWKDNLMSMLIGEIY